MLHAGAGQVGGWQSPVKLELTAWVALSPDQRPLCILGPSTLVQSALAGQAPVLNCKSILLGLNDLNDLGKAVLPRATLGV